MGFFANPFVLPALIGGAGNLIGSIMDRHSARKANRLAVTQMAKQDEFARMGIRWRVEDAIAAGLHPLAALSAGGASMSPSFQLMNDSGSDIARSIGQMGQDLTRPAQAGMTVEEKEFQRLALERSRMETDMMRQNWLDAMKPRPKIPMGPSIGLNPLGQGAVDIGDDGVAQRKVVDPQRYAEHPKAGPDVDYSVTDSGLSPQIPEWLSESMEGESPFLPIGQVMWTVRNRVVPNVSMGNMGKPSRGKLPRWANDWKWSFLRQEWQPIMRRKVKGR